MCMFVCMYVHMCDNCTFKLCCCETDAILKQKARDAFRPQPKCTCVWQRWIFRPHLWACVFIIAQVRSLDFRPRAKGQISSSVLSEKRVLKSLGHMLKMNEIAML